MSVPFFGKEFMFTQPDGKAIRLRGFGDQYYAFFETMDGHAVVKNAQTGFYEIADVSHDGNHLLTTGIRADLSIRKRGVITGRGVRLRSAVIKERALTRMGLVGVKRRWEIRREVARKACLKAFSRGIAAAPPAHPIKGSYTGLCILIEFPDVQQTIPQSSVDAFCNKTGYDEFGNKGSVYDYFYDISQGLLKYNNIVTAYYCARKPRSYYTNPGIEYGSRAQMLIKEALASLKAAQFDFTRLSADSAGYIYAINAFYAGPTVNNWAEGLWPHSSSLQNPVKLAPGRIAADYQITNIGTDLTLDTFCHENGHMICDFPDLYDYGYESQGVGIYCLMCAGGNADPHNPTKVCGYLRYKAGWATSVKKAVTGSASLSSKKNDFIIHFKDAKEYYLIENRFRAGRDEMLPGSGLAIWHVDEMGSNNNEQMTPNQHYECALEQADGKFELELAANIGNSGDLYSSRKGIVFSDTTKPSNLWWDGTRSGLTISNVGKSGQTIKFKISI